MTLLHDSCNNLLSRHYSAGNFSLRYLRIAFVPRSNRVRLMLHKKATWGWAFWRWSIYQLYLSLQILPSSAHFCSRDLSHSTTTSYGYYLCFCNFWYHASTCQVPLFNISIWSNQRWRLNSYLLSGFPSSFNTWRLGSSNPCREKHPQKKIQWDWGTHNSWAGSIFHFMPVHVSLSQSIWLQW